MKEEITCKKCKQKNEMKNKRCKKCGSSLAWKPVRKPGLTYND